MAKILLKNMYIFRKTMLRSDKNLNFVVLVISEKKKSGMNSKISNVNNSGLYMEWAVFTGCNRKDAYMMGCQCDFRKLH